MHGTLMNKNTPVVKLQIDHDTAAIVKITEALGLAYLPIGIRIPNKKELNEWWFSRCIPASWEIIDGKFTGRTKQAERKLGL